MKASILKHPVFLKKFFRYLMVGVCSMVLLFASSGGIFSPNKIINPNVYATNPGYCEAGSCFIGDPYNPQNNDAGNENQWEPDPSSTGSDPYTGGQNQSQGAFCKIPLTCSATTSTFLLVLLTGFFWLAKNCSNIIIRVYQKKNYLSRY